MNNLSVIQKNGKFVVAKNGEPILPAQSCGGQAVITQFESREDAEKYMSILTKLSKQKKYQKS